MKQISETKSGQPVRGVNLGGWLVLEKWMKPSLFSGMRAKDETSWCVELGREEASRRLREHWDTWITEADFAWIADHGFNAVRIPVGHWIFGSASGYPYHECYGANPNPYVDGGIERLDRAFDWAERHGLAVLVDLHCAPGCQNAFDNGGLAGVCDWHKEPDYVDFAIRTLERLAERYGTNKSLWGIETLNEPRWDRRPEDPLFVPDETLLDFDRRAYEAIRKHCPPEHGAVVLHDGFRGPRIAEVFGGFGGPAFRNVILDAHRYQCFDDYHKALDAAGNVRDAEENLAAELRELDGNVLPTVVGEWSLGTGGQRTDAERRAFFHAQIKAFEDCHGAFFWSYKIESGNPDWSLRDAVERGVEL